MPTYHRFNTNTAPINLRSEVAQQARTVSTSEGPWACVYSEAGAVVHVTLHASEADAEFGVNPLDTVVPADLLGALTPHTAIATALAKKGRPVDCASYDSERSGSDILVHGRDSGGSAVATWRVSKTPGNASSVVNA